MQIDQPFAKHSLSHQTLRRAGMGIPNVRAGVSTGRMTNPPKTVGTGRQMRFKDRFHPVALDNGFHLSLPVFAVHGQTFDKDGLHDSVPTVGVLQQFVKQIAVARMVLHCNKHEACSGKGLSDSAHNVSPFAVSSLKSSSERI